MVKSVDIKENWMKGTRELCTIFFVNFHVNLKLLRNKNLKISGDSQAKAFEDY